MGLLNGTSNPSNLTWGEGGRLGIVDFEGNPCVIRTPGGDAVDGFGFVPLNEIFTNAIDNLTESLTKILNGDASLKEIVRNCRRNDTDQGSVVKVLIHATRSRACDFQRA